MISTVRSSIRTGNDKSINKSVIIITHKWKNGVFHKQRSHESNLSILDLPDMNAGVSNSSAWVRASDENMLYNVI